MWNRRFLTIFVILVTEVLGFALILPFLPFFAQELGASPLMIGFLFAVFPFFQLFSAPIMGKLSDHYGRRPLLLFSQLVTGISFLMLGFADSLWMIFLSRMLDGLFGSNLVISEAYLGDISTKKGRSAAFGISGAAFGFGLLIGPGIGGWLAQYSYSLPSFLAAGMSIVTMAMIYLFLPETIKRKSGRMDSRELGLRGFGKYLGIGGIRPLLVVFFTYLLAHSIFISMLALFTERQLGFGPAEVGLFLAYVGLISIIIRGLLLPRLIGYFGETRLKYAGFVSTIAGLGMGAFVVEWQYFIFAMTLFAFGSGVSRPVLLGDISRKVPKREQGAIMGVANSIGSTTHVLGPLIGGFMIHWFFAGSVMVLGALIMLVGLGMMASGEKSGLRKVFGL